MYQSFAVAILRPRGQSTLPGHPHPQQPADTTSVAGTITWWCALGALGGGPLVLGTLGGGAGGVWLHSAVHAPVSTAESSSTSCKSSGANTADRSVAGRGTPAKQGGMGGPHPHSGVGGRLCCWPAASLGVVFFSQQPQWPLVRWDACPQRVPSGGRFESQAQGPQDFFLKTAVTRLYLRRRSVLCLRGPSLDEVGINPGVHVPKTAAQA